jgi:malonyl-CoA O-methyltransferase
MLPVRAAYTQWAPHYDAETAVTLLEDQMISTVAVPASAQRMLDAGCGTGRRLRQPSTVRGVGIDLTFAMLAHAREPLPLAAADVRALPFSSETFDIVYCRLVLGHLPDPQRAYGELARVCMPDGLIIVTDFHADAARAGHRRTFKGADGHSHEVEHYVHAPEEHVLLAESTGLRVERCENAVVGPAIRDRYVAAGMRAQYEAQLGLPLVLMLVCRANPR